MPCLMTVKIFAIGFALLSAVASGVRAQTSTFNAWFFSNHQQKLSEKWNLLSDVQWRSSDRLKFLQTILIRPGLRYDFSKKQSVAVGYAYLGNWEETAGKRTFALEHRVWEQYNLKLTAGRIEINNRVRLEQRFLEASRGFDFAQRFRYYIRSQLPLVNRENFTKGIYVALQNEIFLNIQNKEAANNRFFDQNRLYGFLGYRFSKKLDVETGYLFRYRITKEAQRNHIVQLVVATSF